MRVLLIHKDLPKRPTRPTQWSQFAQFKSDLTDFAVTWITFEGLKLRIDVWPVTGEYEIVLGEFGGKYVKDELVYQVHDLDGERIDVPDIETAVANERTFLEGELPGEIGLYVVDGDVQAWLTSHGFERNVEGEE